MLAAMLLAGCGGGDDTPTAASPGTPVAAPSGATPGGSTSTLSTSAAPSAEPTTATGPAPDGTPPAPAARRFADQTLELVNAARAQARSCGATAYPAAPPLRWQSQVEQAALVQAQYLQQNNLFSHTGANGSSVGDRLTATGYVWATVGENIAAGYADLPTVVRGWLDSPGHCANVMNPTFTDLGVTLVPGASSNTYRTYWAMVLARPR
jgi:uncharacterized protein YkwD